MLDPSLRTSGRDSLCRLITSEASDLAAPCRAAYGERTRTMEIVIAAVVLAAGLVIAAALLVKRAQGLARAGTASPAKRGTATPVKAADAAEADDAYARRQEIGRLE